MGGVGFVWMGETKGTAGTSGGRGCGGDGVLQGGYQCLCPDEVGARVVWHGGISGSCWSYVSVLELPRFRLMAGIELAIALLLIVSSKTTYLTRQS